MINKNISVLILMLSFNNLVNCMNVANGINKPIINAAHKDLRKLLKVLEGGIILLPTAMITQRVNNGINFLSNLQGATEKDKRNFRKYIIAIQARAIAAHPGHNFNFSPLP
jgi:hypothetical protein